MIVRQTRSLARQVLKCLHSLCRLQKYQCYARNCADSYVAKLCFSNHASEVSATIEKMRFMCNELKKDIVEKDGQCVHVVDAGKQYLRSIPSICTIRKQESIKAMTTVKDVKIISKRRISIHKSTEKLPMVRAVDGEAAQRRYLGGGYILRECTSY